MPAVRTLLGPAIEGLREETDVAELYFADFSWLDLGGDESSPGGRGGSSSGRGRRQKTRVDAIRKVVLEPEARVKRCTRCCAVLEDRPFGTRNVAMGQLLRVCLCGDWWMNEECVGF